MSGACPQIVLSLENQKNPMQWNDNFFRNRTCDEHVKLCWGAAAMRCELRPTLDTIGKHASFISNDESHFVTFYSYFGSHILWLFTAILEVTNCVCSGYGGGYWIWKHKICLDTGGNIGGWIQIVTNWGEMHIPCPNSLQPSRYHLVSTTNTHRVQLVVWPQCSTDYNVDIV